MSLLPKIVMVCLAFFSTGPGIPAVHPLHVSTTEINFNAKEKTLEITSSIFTDDFETILSKKSKQKVDLSDAALHKKMDDVIKVYLQDHLSFRLDGKSFPVKYLGFEIENEAVNVFCEISPLLSFSRLEITNTLLHDLFEDQISILHVTRSGKRKSTKMAYPERTYIATF